MYFVYFNFGIKQYVNNSILHFQGDKCNINIVIVVISSTTLHRYNAIYETCLTWISLLFQGGILNIKLKYQDGKLVTVWSKEHKKLKSTPEWIMAFQKLPQGYYRIVFEALSAKSGGGLNIAMDDISIGSCQSSKCLSVCLCVSLCVSGVCQYVCVCVCVLLLLLYVWYINVCGYVWIVCVSRSISRVRVMGVTCVCVWNMKYQNYCGDVYQALYSVSIFLSFSLSLSLSLPIYLSIYLSPIFSSFLCQIKVWSDLLFKHIKTKWIICCKYAYYYRIHTVQ